MALDIEALKTEAQSCINALDNTCSGQSVLLSAISATIETDVSISVPSVGNLPDLTINSISNGTTVYVVDQDAYFVANGPSWIGLYGKVLRDDSRRELYAWGRNGAGSIGDGTITDRCVPTQECTAATNWCAVSGGYQHTAAVKTTGELYAWGCNYRGKLGDGTTINRREPTQESTATNWCAVAGGEHHTAAIKTTGELYAWGQNLYGRLGEGTTSDKCVPTQESTAATDWCAVSADQYQTVAIKTTGALYGWGGGFCGALGDGTITNRCVPTQECTAATDWCAVSAGFLYTAAVKTTGALYAWGRNCAGQIGDGTVVDKCVPTQECTAATDWCAVTAGGDQTAAIKTNGTLYAWGRNLCGELGDGTSVDKCVPTQESTAATDWCAVSAGGDHTAAIKTTGQLYSWGRNTYGQLGDGTTVAKCVPTQECTAATDWCAMSAGCLHTAAIKRVT